MPDPCTHVSCRQRLADFFAPWTCESPVTTSNRDLVRGYACADYRFAAAGGAVGRQAGIANLVEQGAVADGQGARRLLAVPVMSLQDLQNDLALQFAGGFAGQSF